MTLREQYREADIEYYTEQIIKKEREIKKLRVLIEDYKDKIESVRKGLEE